MPKIFFLVIIFLTGFCELNLAQEIKTITTGVLNEKAKILPMPKMPPVLARIAGQVIVQVRINLQTGDVVSATAVSGHPLLRLLAEKAAMEAKFEPILKEFDTIYATGVLIYKIENFNGKIIENKNPRPILPVIDSSKAIINGKAIKLEKPEYPENARNSCAKGKVEVLTLFHNTKGDVIAAKAISGNELLFESAEKAVMKSKFSTGNFDNYNDFYLLGKIVYNFDSFAKCLSAGIVNKKAIYLPKPQFSNPTNTKHFRIKEEQIVAVQVVIDMDGKVTSANAIFGHALLRSSCEYAARQAKFSPVWDLPRILVSALLVYKFKPDGTIDTNVESNDKNIISLIKNFVR